MVRKLSKIISQEEFEQIFQAAINIEKKSKSQSRKTKIKKYRVAMLLGFEAGLRISEIVGWKDKVPPLIKENIRDADILILSGKGSKDRIVPRPKRLNENARAMFPLGIKRRSLQNFVTRLGNTVLHRNISFHTLRHGFGSHLAGKQRPLHEIQMLMGHSRLDTTGIYLHANPKQAIDGARDVF